MRSIFTILSLLLLSSCASLPENMGRTASYAYTDTSDTSLGRFSKALLSESTHEDGFTLLSNGLDAFVARVVLTEVAERSIDLQYYLFHQDLVGELLTAHLVRAAERGIRVRILVDDMDMDGRDAELLTLDSHPNIQIRIFNPFDREVARAPQFVTGLGSLTRRMHNKSFTADNQISILGGRNIGNEYFEADPAVKFADLDVMVAGKAVKEVSTVFDQYWNSSMVYPVDRLVKGGSNANESDFGEQRLEDAIEYLELFLEEQATSNYMTAVLNSDLINKIQSSEVQYFTGDAVVMADDPEKVTQSRDANDLHLITQLAPYLSGVEKELIIVSPYFIPGEEGVQFFQALTSRGVRVRILTNSLSSSDVGVVHAGYSNYRKQLLRSGVELYELNKTLTRQQRKEKRAENKAGSSISRSSLHAKTFVIDRKYVFIGSLNLDPRSFYENTEIGIVLHQPEMASLMAEGFNNNLKDKTFRLELTGGGDVPEEIVWHGMDNGEPVSFDVEPYTSFWRRLGVRLMSLLPIESQL